MYGVDVDTNVYGMRLETRGTGRSHQAEALRPARVGANPLFCLTQIARQYDGVARGHRYQHFTGLSAIAVQNRLYKSGHVFSTERPHGDGKVEAVVLHHIASPRECVQHMASSIFAVSKIG